MYERGKVTEFNDSCFGATLHLIPDKKENFDFEKKKLCFLDFLIIKIDHQVYLTTSHFSK